MGSGSGKGLGGVGAATCVGWAARIIGAFPSVGAVGSGAMGRGGAATCAGAPYPNANSAIIDPASVADVRNVRQPSGEMPIALEVRRNIVSRRQTDQESHRGRRTCPPSLSGGCKDVLDGKPNQKRTSGASQICANSRRSGPKFNGRA